MTEIKQQHEKYTDAVRVYLKEKEGSMVVAETMITDIIALAIMCYLDDVAETEVFVMDM